ncbi:MAG: lipid-A-disaccharide synthase [Gammaproteobacteria bacterium]|nr:lipid-A-disaccharide synthase [Gammaproteobacteria bacterium]
MSEARRDGRRPLRVAMAAGEASGDALGAGLIEALRVLRPSIRFEGIAGPAMEAAGCVPVYPMERLSIMGFAEVAPRYLGLMRDRARLAKHWLRDPPDVFIGIDAPDFMLGLERRLRAGGIPAIHYVSPSVWAWRRGRLKSIARAVNHMLVLFPFEESIYRGADIGVTYVGHPLADTLPARVDAGVCRRALGLDPDRRWLALLPGSRKPEIKALAGLLLESAERLRLALPDLGFIMPAASTAIYTDLLKLAESHRTLPLVIVKGRAHDAVGAANVVLVASGTAALETMLLKRPMVVTYKVNLITYHIMKRLLTVPYVSLPNLLAGEALVPELLQAEATPGALCAAVLRWLREPAQVDALTRRFDELHRLLHCGGASARAAAAVLDVTSAHERQAL